MGKYIVKRVLLLIPTALLVCFIVFMLMRMLPGDAVDALRRVGRKYIDWGPEQPERFVHPDALPWRWYVRCRGALALPGAETVAAAEGETACLTAPMTRRELDAALAGREALRCLRLLE